MLSACERLRLPAELARRWQALPRLAHAFDPAAAPPVPHADAG